MNIRLRWLIDSAQSLLMGEAGLTTEGANSLFRPVRIVAYPSAAGTLLTIFDPVVLLVSGLAASSAAATLPFMCIASLRTALAAHFAILRPVMILVSCFATRRASASIPFVRAEYAENTHYCALDNADWLRRSRQLKISSPATLCRHCGSRSLRKIHFRHLNSSVYSLKSPCRQSMWSKGQPAESSRPE
jgi:hypothetical protein